MFNFVSVDFLGSLEFMCLVGRSDSETVLSFDSLLFFSPYLFNLGELAEIPPRKFGDLNVVLKEVIVFILVSILIRSRCTRFFIETIG